MPEARIRVAALHLARARTLPLLCLGIGGGLQSRLVHHARSALKLQNCRAPRARTGERLLMSALAAATRFVSGRLKNSLIPSSPPTKHAAPTLQTLHPLPRSSKNLRLWTDTS